MINKLQKDVQQLSMVEEDVPLEQQWSSSLDQEDPEPPPHIKEEQEELWTNQEGEQLQGLQEPDILFMFTSVPLKSEEDGEKAQSSQLHESQTEENREAERTEAEGEDRGGLEPARNSDPDSPLQPATHDKTADSSEPETDDSGDWEETREPHSGLNSLQNNEEHVSDVECNTGKTSVSSSGCAGSFGHEEHLQKHSGVQKKRKTHCCSVCDVQQLLVVKAEVPPEQHEWSSSLDQEEPEPPPHIKEELWTSQEGEQLQGLEEADIKFPFTSVPVKSEEDGEKAQSSQLHESQTEENREAERTEAEGEDRGGPEPARNSDPDSPLQPATHDKTADSSEPETDDSIDWVETREPQSGLNPLQNNVEPGSDVKLNTGNPSFSSSECAGSFGHEEHLQKPTGVQKRGKKYCCSVCGKGYTRKKSLCSHMRLHSEGKGFTCSVCKAIFSLRSNLTIHMRIHTGEKPFSCSVCDKRYAQKGNLKKHLIAHTHTTFSCSVCGKGFSLNKTLMTHMRLHSENVSPAQFVK
ncbi:gastrula zinc finger protein xFG20-1-like isoform X2 [Perca fluviatilis]|uniref:gastrula zinc finger protein xFG20-1-like isoform X2 n=1 Tax=Perca fluviatilis TaxID=8168 RepID=UPI001965DBB5|nr:gastrula zinc finger protein xFG20-1-like isoform X2 [Perca fluviatilis]